MMGHPRSFASVRPSTRLSTSTFILVLLLLLFLLPTAAQAQLLYGTIAGNVTDTSGAAIPNADVQATNTQTGVNSNTKSDSAGIFRFSNLQPGTYKVTIKAPNFTTSVSNNVDIRVNQIQRVDAQLKVATTEQNVTVTAETPLLQTDKADVHTDLTQKQVEDLPTAGSQGRNFQSLLRVIPGAGGVAETNSLSG